MNSRSNIEELDTGELDTGRLNTGTSELNTVKITGNSYLYQKNKKNTFNKVFYFNGNIL